MISKRLDTKHFSNGAEFLVLSKLLLTNIQAYKTYINFEGYDLVCVNPEKNLSAKIQVKSKNFKGDSSFYLNDDKKAKPDFYVFAQTNAIRRKPKSDQYKLIPDNEIEPKLYLLSTKDVKKYRKKDKKGTLYILLNSIPNKENYLNNWDKIKKFLKIPIGVI